MSRATRDCADRGRRRAPRPAPRVLRAAAARLRRRAVRDVGDRDASRRAAVPRRVLVAGPAVPPDRLARRPHQRSARIDSPRAAVGAGRGRARRSSCCTSGGGSPDPAPPASARCSSRSAAPCSGPRRRSPPTASAPRSPPRTALAAVVYWARPSLRRALVIGVLAGAALAVKSLLVIPGLVAAALWVAAAATGP